MHTGGVHFSTECNKGALGCVKLECTDDTLSTLTFYKTDTQENIF